MSSSSPIYIENLAISGGSIKGIAICSAIKALEDNNIRQNIKRIAGTSIGAVIATFFALGFTSNKMIEIAKSAEFENIKDNESIITKTNNFIDNYGLNKNTNRYNWLKSIFEDNGIKYDITFENIYSSYQKELTIIGTCVNKKSTVYFNHINNPRMQVIVALLISTCIPFIFEPVKWKKMYYVDGALFCDYPINIFKSIDPHFSKTIGLCTNNYKNKNAKSEIDDVTDYLETLIDAVYYGTNSSYNDTLAMGRTITVCTHKFPMTNLLTSIKITDEIKEKLIEDGYNSVVTYLKKIN